MTAGRSAIGPEAAGPEPLPSVSVVMPVRNGAATLEQSLAAIGVQTYPGPVDVAVALAPSTDGTARILEEADLGLDLKVVENPTGSTAAGLNLAIAATRGRIVARVDAQAVIGPDYIQRAVAALARTGAANVGGVQRPVAGQGLAAAIAAALASPFGAGPARYRTGRSEGPADTVYLGVFDRAALEQVGGFDETMVRNQDYELNWRLRHRGLTVWLDPGLAVGYIPRSTYRDLARQYFEYGVWKRVMLWRNPRSLRLRQAAAPLLIAAMAASAVELGRGRWRGLVVPLGYALGAGAAARRTRATLARRRDQARAGLAFAVIHFSWGAGFLAGRRRPRR